MTASFTALPAAPARLGAAFALSLALHAWLLQTLAALPPDQGSATLAGSVAGQHRLSARLLSLPATVPADNEAPMQKEFFAAPRQTPRGELASGQTIARITPQAAEASPQPTTLPEQQAAPGLFTLPVPRYYFTSELDVQPGIMTSVMPVYPEAEARNGTSATVQLRLLINENGMLDEVSAERTESNAAFIDSALKAFTQARFTPGRVAGQNVKAQMYIEIRYDSGRVGAFPTDPPQAYSILGGGRTQSDLPPLRLRFWKRPKTGP